MNYRLLLLTFLMPLFGCAGTSSFRAFNADSPISALDEISSRRRAFNNFRTSMTIGLETPKGRAHLKCVAEVERGVRWQLKLNGPLGVDIATIDIDNERFVMNSFHNGEKLDGFIDEPIYIQALDVELPALQYLAPMLIPFPNIVFQQDWKIIESNVDKGSDLEIITNSNEVSKKFNLKLDYSPLRVYQEEFNTDDFGPVRRIFVYKNLKEIVPSDVEIRMEGMTMFIHYNSITLNKAAKSQSQFAPL